MVKNVFNKPAFRKISALILLLLFLVAGRIDAKQKNTPVESILAGKVFPFVTYLEKSPKAFQTVREHSELRALGRRQKKRIILALKQCREVRCYAEVVKWRPEETTLVVSSLVKLYRESEQFSDMISKLRDSGHYHLFTSSSDEEFIKAVWNSVSEGVTHILDVYMKGENPFYAEIDAISFAAGDENFLAGVKNMLVDEVEGADGGVFHELPVNAAIHALMLNGRDEAARYEPLDQGMNKAAFENIGNINWDDYRYSVILVPGQGPEEEGVSIDPQSIARCKLAAEFYESGAAPFIVVSGGHVHPNKTPFSEAVEMKKYMTAELNIPEKGVFIEPHARHTTTNMRNTARLIYRFNIPDDKKVLIVTDPVQNAFIHMMEKRFMMELGCVPYRDLKKLTENTSEYYPDRQALQCNPLDPLDP